MPLDPTISLHGFGDPSRPQPQNMLGAVMSDPVHALSGLADIQNKQNQNVLFQQDLAARTRAGEIISQSPDIEAAIAGILKDPVAAIRGHEIVNNLRSSLQTLAATNNLKATGNRDAIQAIMRASAQAIANPGKLDEFIGQQMSLLPPDIQRGVMPAAQSFRNTLLHNLPEDPAKASALLAHRLVGAWTSAVGDPKPLEGMLGSPVQFSTGDRENFGVRPPVQFGAGMNVSSSFSRGSPGGMQIIDGVPVPAPAVSGEGIMRGPSPSPGPAANPLMPPADPGIAGDDKPLLAPNALSPAVGRGGGLAGLNILSPSQRAREKHLQDEFSGPGLAQYQSATASLGALDFMESALDQLVSGGGFLIPGTASEFRSQLAKAVNTLQAATGKEPVFDPSKLASVDEFTKQARRMTLMVTNQFLGGQREAASVIAGIGQSVPSLDSTFLGAKLVSASLRATAQRAIDQRNFENTWASDPRNQGNLAGAAEAFNRLHPAKDYANQVLAKFGMDQKGFKSPEAIGEAVRMGWLTPTQAKAELVRQFPDRFKKGD